MSMKTWFTSDHHFGHRQILFYEAANRPWNDVQEMDRAMIGAWNRVVKPEDVVYYLGDFALTAKTRKKEILSKLNGYKIAIRGNHDAGPKHMVDIGFDEVYQWLILRLHRPEMSTKRILLIHEANELLKRESTRRLYHYILCGHVHSNWKRRGHAINVGVDQWDFKPIGLEQALAVLTVKVPAGWKLEKEREPKTTSPAAFLELSASQCFDEE